jgi:hypothetical protein
MNLLRLGSKGPQVTQLQLRLNETYEEQIAVDGNFGPKTEEMVIDFQETNDLDADGIVGPETWQALFETAPLEDAPPGGPVPVPTPVPPPSGIIGQSQLTSLFGKPRDPAPYLVLMNFSEFSKAFSAVKDYEGNPWSCHVYGHKLMEAPLRQAFKNLVASGYVKELKTFDGCVCVRPMTSGNGWSVHSWGLAIDFNALRNAYGAKPTFSAGFVKCFTDAGFEWGGNWHTPDGMHFQLPRTWL